MTGILVTFAVALVGAVAVFVKLRHSPFGPVVACAVFGAAIALSGCVGIIDVGINR